VKVLEFEASNPILVLLLCGLKDYGIVSSVVPAGRLLIIDLIE
jgi:hypothetical protein